LEGRRDPYAASSARCGRARAASLSFAFDVARPGVAGAACGDGPGGAPGRDAADRHSRHDRALAARHRPPPAGAAVAPGPLRAPGNARTVRLVVLLLARENESRGTGGPPASSRGPASRWRRPRSGRSSTARGSTGLRTGVARAGRSSSAPRRRGSWRWTSSPPACSTARRSASLPSSSMDLEDAGTRAKTILHDPDASFTAPVDSVFQAASIRVFRSAVQAPRMNAYAERFVLTAPDRDYRPDTDLRPAASAAGPGRVRGPLQPTAPHRSLQLQPPRPHHPVADLSRKQIKRWPVLGGLIKNMSGPHRSPDQDP
jgi:hypothetical protein